MRMAAFSYPELNVGFRGVLFGDRRFSRLRLPRRFRCHPSSRVRFRLPWLGQGDVIMVLKAESDSFAFSLTNFEI